MNLKGITKIKNFQWKFLMSYLLILVIPLLLGSFVYRMFVNIVEEDAKRLNSSILEQTRDILDRRLEEVNAIANQIIMDKKVNTLLTVKQLEPGSPEYFKVWSVWSHIPNYRLTNNFIENFYVMFKNANVIVSAETTYTRTPSISRIVIGKEGETRDEMKEELWNHFYNREYIPVSSFTIDKEMHSQILYMQSFPLQSRRNPEGLLMVSINKHEVDKLLENVNIGDRGLVAVVDAQGQVITHISGSECSIKLSDIMADQPNSALEEKVSRDKMIISTIRSDRNGWKYISVVPYEFIMARVDGIKRVVAGTALLVLLGGIAMAYFLAYRNSKPIGDIINMIRGMIGNPENKNDDAYDYLQQTIFYLVKNNKNLQHQMEKQVALLKANLFGSLLNQDFSGEKELETYISNIGVELNGKSYAVLILQLSKYEDLMNDEILEELKIIRVIVEDLLKNCFKQKIFLHDMAINKIGVLLTYESDDKEENMRLTEEAVKYIYEQLYQGYKIKFFCAGGNIYPGLTDVKVSFEEAKKVLEQKDYRYNGKVFWYHQIPRDSEIYYYPIDTEIRLIGSLKKGDAGEVKKIFEVLNYENVVERQLSAEMIQQLLYAIRGTVLRETSQKEYHEYFEEDILNMTGANTLEAIFSRIEKICFKICDMNQRKKESENKQLKNEVMNYLNHAYVRGELSLFMLASKFGVTESYMYQFFKEYFGASFTVFLEDLRIQKACELLSQSGIPVKDLAACVGYSNDQTFRRAFKRVIGVNPTDYRSAVAEKMVSRNF